MKCPVTLFTGLSAHDPFRCILDREPGEIRKIRMTPPELVELHKELATSLLDMHKKVGVKENIRRNSRLRNNRNSRIQLYNLDKGDFVLVATSKPKDKLEARWKGPFRIVTRVNDSVFEVEALILNSENEVHVTRLRPYNDRELNSQLKEHIQYHNHCFEVIEILDEREHKGIKEVLVKWRGFEDDEATWEPQEVIAEDVPQLYHAFKRV
jgi:tRNA nucleotidyltransferase/poly(A) polymerase